MLVVGRFDDVVYAIDTTGAVQRLQSAPNRTASPSGATWSLFAGAYR